jgi:hypothetical protein
MPIIISLFCLGWGTLAFFFVLLVRIGAQPAPKPPGLLRRDSPVLGSRRNRPAFLGFA